MAQFSHRLVSFIFISDLIISNLTILSDSIHDRISQLDEIMPTVYTLFTFLSAGSFRGTEGHELTWSVRNGLPRNLFLLNGMMTLVTRYVKTQNTFDTGRLASRSMPFEFTRLLVVLYGTVFPAARALMAFISTDNEAINRYRSHLFVLHGKSMQAKHFSSALQDSTQEFLGCGFGLRATRQILHTLIVFHTGLSFDIEDDDDLKAVHDNFGHNAQTAHRNYSVYATGTVREISMHSVLESQQVSIRWHSFYRLGHPHYASQNLIEQVKLQRFIMNETDKNSDTK